MSKSTYVILSLLIPFWVYAQKDSVILDEIQVQAKHIKEGPGAYAQDLKLGLREQGSIVENLEKNSFAFIKNYGPASLSTAGIRGASAAQTQILWNGMPLNSPMLGLLDLRILPTFFFESALLSTGNGASLWGSGNIGGSIHLENKMPAERLSYQLRYLSTHYTEQNVRGRYQWGKLIMQSKMQHITAKNNFNYVLNGVLTEQQNAQQNGLQFMQDAYLPIGKQAMLECHYWYNQTARGIPKSIFPSLQKESTADQWHRINAQFKQYFRNGYFQWNTAYFRENNSYFISEERINDNRFQRLLSEWTWRHKMAQWNFLAGVQSQWVGAESNNYNGLVQQYQASVYGEVAYETKWMDILVHARKDWVTNQQVPWVPSVELEWLKKDWATFIVKTGRTYRLPSLNDIYWAPGGNRNLLPESGWSHEMSYRGKRKQWSWVFNAYSRNIDNWILWSRQAGDIFFTAYNITEVWSRGIEAEIAFQKQWMKMAFQWRSAYTHTLSTVVQEVSLPRLDEGQQLWYTPVQQWKNNMQFHYRGWGLEQQWNYVSESLGINENIPAYFLIDMRIRKSFNIKKIKMSLEGGVNNALNQYYQVVERRPMPGRHYEVAFHLNIE